MDALPTVLLKPGEADRVIAGHPWVYQGAILRTTHPPHDGGVVQVKDHRQRFLGVGFYNSKSKINVRLVASERVPIDETFFEKRILSALDVRRRHLPQATSFRVVNSEGDFLSGLIVDKYEDVLTLQTSALGMDQRKSDILAVLKKIFDPRAVVERNDIAARQFEGLSDSIGVLAGTLEKETIVRVNGLQFATDLLSGQKTGFLDQQMNYQRVAGLAALHPGARVLDCFTFLGGLPCMQPERALHMCMA
jgi:23S rRNA (cytosine1962-C5)-methyltransferase